MSEFKSPPLSGLDGANPLAFLAALGTLAVLAETEPQIKLGWESGARWVPYLVSPRPLEESELLKRLTVPLRGKPVDSAKEKLRESAQQRLDAAKTQLKHATKVFKARKLPRGKERDAAWEQQIVPLQRVRDIAIRERLAALKEAVPSPELAIGERPDCKIEEFRDYARTMRAESGPESRRVVDLLASFGAEVSNIADERIAATQFCFITGGGHQWFLGTARQLMTRKNPTSQDPEPSPCVTETNLRNCLFAPWTYSDEGLSMRWDPVEDTRYALRFDNPSSAGSYTVWMANLLAYMGLALFPCSAVSRGSIATACWLDDKDTPAFQWPIWQEPLSMNVIRSLLMQRAFASQEIAAERSELRARGISAVFSSNRLKIGSALQFKLNFSPACGV